jgi:IS30 family transposase
MEVVKIKKKQRIRFERIQSIFTMRRQKKTIREISKICACSPSTVSATLTKYRHPDPRTWRGMNRYEKAKYVWDQQKATARSKRRYRGHIADAWMRTYVEEKLTTEGWSPEIISNKLKIEHGKSLSTNTIYRYVKKNRARLTKCLWYKGKPRKQRIAHRRGTLRKHERAEKKRITERNRSSRSVVSLILFM